MDISGITDLDKLKSLAYDQLRDKRQAEMNLRIIEQQISKIESSADNIAPVTENIDKEE